MDSQRLPLKSTHVRDKESSLEINALSTLMFLFSLSLVIGYYFIQKFQQKRLNGKASESDLLKGVTL